MRIIKILNTISLNLWFYFWAPFVVFACLIIFVPFVTMVRIFNPARVMYYFRRSINLYGKAVTLTGWPWIRVKLHDLPSHDNIPYVFVENHASSFDPFVQGVLPYEIVQSARGWALRFPVLGRFARWAGYIDVDNSDGDQLIEKAKKLLNEKVSIVFFPEGTRSTDGTLGAFHSAAFRIAIETATPMVPVIITGIADKPAKGSFIMHPGVIDINFMNVIIPENFKGKTSFVLKKEIRAKMENHASMGIMEN
jgi:1-acyl-sn-glycerol-3-phosphate acyltransferase